MNQLFRPSAKAACGILTLILTTAVRAEMADVSVPPQEPSSQGEVSIGVPLPGSRAASSVQVPREPASAAPGIPLIGGNQTAQPSETGKAVTVYTTMQAAARAGVNPLAPASAVARQQIEPNPTVEATGPLSVTDETLWGRFSALPLGVKLGGLILLVIGGIAAREWKRR